ncbi:hypothetical protein ES703_104081 [subsurface metagenome]
MRRADSQVIHQRDRILRHVAQPVGRSNRDLQEAQLQQFDRAEAFAAAHLAGLADVAVVEADHPETARGKLAAEIVVPMDHLGAEPHDQHDGVGVGIAENLVTDVDAVDAGNLRRLVVC